MTQLKKLLSMVNRNTGEERHVFLERFWDYFMQEYKYCVVAIRKDQSGRVQRQENWLETGS